MTTTSISSSAENSLSCNSSWQLAISDIAGRLREVIAFRALAANNAPDFRSVSDYRKDTLEALSGQFLQALALCQRAALDGKEHSGAPNDKAQRNFTDADSRIMPAPGGRDFQQAYNCQAVVDSAHQVIVAARAANLTSDNQQAADMVEETLGNVGAVPKEVSADAGYYSAKAVEAPYALGVEPFVAPEQTRHGRIAPPAPPGGGHTQ